jgi:glycosyltransferase involved in cell wall biosynthesis
MGARAAVYLDADGEYDPAEIPALLAPIEAGEADYVIGSRYRGRRSGQKPGRLLGNAAFTTLVCIAAGRLITDGQTGFRAFSRRALACAEIVHDYNYAQVLTLDLLRKGMKYREVPITYRTRTRGRSFISARYAWRVPLGIARQMLKY